MTKGKAYRFFASLRLTTLALIALAGLFACAQISVPEEPDDDGWSVLTGNQPIRFSSNVSIPATKTGSPLPSNTHFGVFAYYQPGTIGGASGTWSSSRTPNFMYNEDVLYNGTTYTYAPIKYWPNNNENTISFWAYCPYNAANLTLRETGTTTAFSNTSTGIPDLFYTVSDGKTDLMVADLVENESKQALSGTVELDFHHLLSKLAFYAKKVDAGSRYTVKLKSVRLDQVYMTATCAYSAGSWAWAGWTLPRANVTSYADDPGSAMDDIELTTSYPAVGSPMATSYVLPQILNYGYSMLHIEYTIWFEGLSEVRTMISNIPLSTVFLDEAVPPSAHWDKEKEYKIYISITPDDPIEFSVIWSDWGTVHNWTITS